jgi:hypothetical protein
MIGIPINSIAIAITITISITIILIAFMLVEIQDKIDVFDLSCTIFGID